MYAADKTIRALLPELNVVARLAEAPFDPDGQIQPCSVDLRLDTRFWISRKVARPPGWRFWRQPVLDLRKRSLYEISPRRRWRRIDLRPGECIDLKPNQVLLARTYEEFSIPVAYAGKIEGRSSYARLGLMVHCTGDFINPGYRGHMPLELVSFAPGPIRLTPLMPIAQLVLVRLTETPNRYYGNQALGSKYVEDDGGPSYWWKDRMFAQINDRMGEHNISGAVRDSLADLISPDVRVEVLERLDRFIQRLPVGEVESGTELMESFAKTEDFRRRTGLLARASLFALATVLLGTTLGSFFVRPFHSGHFITWGATIAAVGLSGLAHWLRAGQYYGVAELEQHANKNQSP